MELSKTYAFLWIIFVLVFTTLFIVRKNPLLITYTHVHFNLSGLENSANIWQFFKESQIAKNCQKQPLSFSEP